MIKFFLIVPLLIFSQEYELMILGTAQDAGFPHLNCNTDHCTTQSLNNQKEPVSSLAILDKTNKSFVLLDASPDLSDQCLLDLQLNDLFNSSSINCFERFTLKTISNGVHLGNTGLIKTLSQFDTEYVPVCIDPNQEVEVKLSLFKEGSSVPDCEISKTFSCSLDRSFLFDDNENGLPCATDCDEPWIGDDEKTDVNAPASKVTIAIPDSDCYIEVDYKHRTACSGSYQDIFIQSYTIGTTSTTENSCTLNWDRARVYEETVTRLMIDNPMEFDPLDDDLEITDPPKCKTNWRVSKSSCWTQFTVGYYPSTIGPGYEDASGSSTFDDGGGIPIDFGNIETRYEPCDADCCVRQFQVCKVYDQNSGTITTTITDLGLVSSGSSCTASKKADLFDNFGGSNTITVDCNYDCNDLDSYNKSFKPVTENNVEIPPRDPRLERIQMLDIVYGDQIEFRVKNSNVSGFSVTVASLDGLIIDKQVFKINNLGENSYFIDISNYKTGTYIYTIDVNGYYFKSNKFQIYK